MPVNLSTTCSSLPARRVAAGAGPAGQATPTCRRGVPPSSSRSEPSSVEQRPGRPAARPARSKQPDVHVATPQARPAAAASMAARASHNARGPLSHTTATGVRGQQGRISRPSHMADTPLSPAERRYTLVARTHAEGLSAHTTACPPRPPGPPTAAGRGREEAASRLMTEERKGRSRRSGRRVCVCAPCAPRPKTGRRGAEDSRGLSLEAEWQPRPAPAAASRQVRARSAGCRGLDSFSRDLRSGQTRAFRSHTVCCTHCRQRREIRPRSGRPVWA